MKTEFSYRIEMAGKTFNKWTVLGFSHIEWNQAHWTCRCECGTVSTVAGRSLRSGYSKTCGCGRAGISSATHRIPHKTIEGVECKRCYRCKKWRSLSEFSKNRKKWDGLGQQCKDCSRVQRNSKPRNKKYYRDYANNRYKTDIHFRVKTSVQARIRGAIKNNWKSARTSELLGCSIEFLKTYLENQFDSSMSWQNYGSYWHIDHIKPCIDFDLSKPEQQMSCFHYTNLQPLEAIENVTKRHKRS